MDRPFLTYGIEQLEAEFESAKAASDTRRLKLLKAELKHRHRARAEKLKKAVEEALAGAAPQPRSDPNQRRQGGGQESRRQTPHSGSSMSGRGAKARHAPTSEQGEAIDRFLQGGSLKINAYAGAGKTSTLQLLAGSTRKYGQYIAFNKSIVKDAKDKFPKTVNCSTTHGLAFRATPSAYRRSKDKMVGKFNANQLAELLQLTKPWRIDRNHTLAPRSQGYLILETVKRFAQSADLEPEAKHVPRHGSLLAAPDPVIAEVNNFAVHGARHVWQRMQDPEDILPLGYDGFLKLWALSRPAIAADFILLDEAQDTNAVVLDVLSRQPAQMVYVGDKYQQIYEWRGAINAMEKIATDHSTVLTLSFRFGEAIAEGASNVLSRLGERTPIRGNPSIQSHIGSNSPQTILARTNASAISAIIEAIDANKKPSLVGGNAELMEMLRAVEGLKNNQPSTIPDFFGFANWNEVVAFAKSGEGEHLLTFVNLVETRGERQLMWALNRTVEEDDAQIVISTAHKAKGREWKTVRLMDDFVSSRSKQSDRSDNAGSNDPAELRLFYVALTRARESVDVPGPLLSLIGR